MRDDTAGDGRRRAGGSPSRRTLVGLLLGLACGLFFGELVAPLGRIGEAYVALLQMTVLPYIVLALIVNVGGLPLGSAKTMARWVALVMLLLWAVTLTAVFVMPLALPEWESGSFFSPSLVEVREGLDLLGLYIPVNPFASLAESVVPAVVVFCLLVGAALIGVAHTEALFQPMRVLLDALGRIARWIAKLNPIGVFALSANAAGTLTLTEFGRLQGYLILYVATAVLLTFAILPALVAALTPFRWRDVVKSSSEPLITAWATDNVFVVLPQLIDNAQRLFRERGLGSEETDETVEVAVPLAFPFPNAGRLLAMIFIPFAAWYTGRELDLMQIPGLAVAGVSSLFAKVTVAIPFLLDLVQLPADLFRLFLLSGVLAGPFNSLAGAMHLFAFTLLTTAGVSGLVRVEPGRWLRQAVPALALVAVSMLAISAYLQTATGRAASETNLLERMEPLGPSVDASVLDTPSFEVPSRASGIPSLAAIRQEGVLRVGFDGDSPPFAYFNAAGSLVGFDVEMAHRLARDLGVELVFNPVDFERLDEQLASGAIDVVMSGVEGTPGRYARFSFTDSYLEASPALLVPDHLRARYDTLEEVEAAPLTLAVFDEPRLLRFVGERLPNATLVPVQELRDFFEGRLEGADALLLTAEAGSAWTMRYPGFHVATPWKERPRWPLGYIVASGDQELKAFLDRWIEMQRGTGAIQKLYEHWVLGLTAVPRSPRWSVIRDVLHWVE